MSTAILNQTNNERLSQHFKAEEFRCKDKTKEFLWSPELIIILETIRSYFKAPIIINSGYRTPRWNSKVNGAPNSYHCKGMAADIVVKGHSSKEVAEYASKLMDDFENKGGVIKYTNFVHIDVREERYRKGVQTTALIKVKDLREAIQLIKTVLEKLDQIYHILKEKE